MTSPKPAADLPAADLPIGEVARATGLSVDALRYYERLGALPRIARRGGRRLYGPTDVAWVAFVAHMRTTGLPLRRIRELATLASRGDATIPERRALVAAHRDAVAAHIRTLTATLGVLDAKLAFYDARTVGPSS